MQLNKLRHVVLHTSSFIYCRSCICVYFRITYRRKNTSRSIDIVPQLVAIMNVRMNSKLSTVHLLASQFSQATNLQYSHYFMQMMIPDIAWREKCTVDVHAHRVYLLCAVSFNEVIWNYAGASYAFIIIVEVF